jgi:hypothetical protein
MAPSTIALVLSRATRRESKDVAAIAQKYG